MYIGNFAIGTAIFFICTISAIPTGTVLYVASFHIFGYEAISKITSKLPEFMQFIEVGSTEPEINSGFYFAVACAIIAAIFIGCALYKMHTNSKEIGENKCVLETLNSFKEEENQTISCYNAEGKIHQNYVVLYKEYTDGCVVQSKSGKKVVKLKYSGQEEHNTKNEPISWSYEVFEYENTEKPKIRKDGFRADFFKEVDARKDVTVYSISPDTFIELSGVVFDTHQKQPKERKGCAA